MRTKKAENATKKILSAIALWNKIWYYYSAVEEILCSCDNLRREKKEDAADRGRNLCTMADII